MPEKMRQELIDQKLFTNKDLTAAISALQHACTLKCSVILHNYSSNNGGTVSDRHVEAYDVRPEDNLVICYDLDKQGTRVFNLNRIGYVEILENESWRRASSHMQIYVDVFHMNADTTTRISLQLDLMAKNLLIEEYPRAKDFITAHKDDENIWYFTTDICRMEGIGRFYIGLAGHIQILEGEPLKQYVADYTRKYLQF
jgi:predicted DNA-binding transcriptional regulator YafY